MALVVKTKTYADNDPIIYSDLNANWDTLYNVVNGNLDNANIAPGAAIVESKIAFSGSGHGHTGGTDGKLIAIGGATSLVENNNVPYQAKDSGGNVRTAVNLDANNDLQIGDSSAGGHIVLNPGTGKFTKQAVNYDNNNSNSYQKNVVILTGWRRAQFGGGTPNLLLSITLPFTLTSVLSAHANAGAGGGSSVAPNSNSLDFGLAATIYNLTTSNISIDVRNLNLANVANTEYVVVYYTVIGVL